MVSVTVCAAASEPATIPLSLSASLIECDPASDAFALISSDVLALMKRDSEILLLEISDSLSSIETLALAEVESLSLATAAPLSLVEPELLLMELDVLWLEADAPFPLSLVDTEACPAPLPEMIPSASED